MKDNTSDKLDAQILAECERVRAKLEGRERTLPASFINLLEDEGETADFFDGLLADAAVHAVREGLADLEKKESLLRILKCR